MPKLPDRWEKYSNIGDVISGTRIVTFKVPLHEGLCRNCPDDMWFTPQSLIEMTEEKGTPLGLVIDLTFTTRYYNPRMFMDHGIAHTKIFVPGKEVPSRKIVKQFCNAIDNFTSDPNNSDKLVGVHCTHGVNRTGHLVCRYMIDRLNIEPETAIKAYGDARGYPIERENYLADLRRVAGEGEDEDEEEESSEDQPGHEDMPDPARRGRDHHGDRYSHGRHDDRNDWRGGGGRDGHWSNDQDQPGHSRDGGGRGGGRGGYGHWRGHEGRSRGGYGGQNHGYQDRNGYSGGYHGNSAHNHHGNNSRGGYGQQNYRGGYGQQNSRGWGGPAYGGRQESWNSYNRPRNAQNGGGGGYGGQNGGWSLDNGSDYGHFGHSNHGYHNNHSNNSSHGNQSHGQTRDDRDKPSQGQKRKAPQ